MVTLTPRAEEIFAQLSHGGQEPRNAGVLLGCQVIRAQHHWPRTGYFNVYVRADGAWTHSETRVYQWRASGRC